MCRTVYKTWKCGHKEEAGIERCEKSKKYGVHSVCPIRKIKLEKKDRKCDKCLSKEESGALITMCYGDGAWK